MLTMRMRRKGNLDIRIRQSRDYLIAYEGVFTNANEYVKDKDYVDFKSVFGNNNPVEIDLGCGLGSFLIEKAKSNPNVNYIGVEKFSNIIISAIEKSRQANLKNIKFINCRAECLEKYIMDFSISTIYLNFSNPLPNKTDEKKRLTSKRFLEIYKKILNNSGHVEQKTDDYDFFEYSIQSFKDSNYLVKNINYDLKNNPVEGNIVTEHENKFMQVGKKINRLEAYKNENL